LAPLAEDNQSNPSPNIFDLTKPSLCTVPLTNFLDLAEISGAMRLSKMSEIGREVDISGSLQHSKLEVSLTEDLSEICPGIFLFSYLKYFE
jgi:hypothetical protein